MVEERIADYAVGSPTRLALNVLAHKWTLLIVLALKAGAMRFSDLRRRVPGGTPQVLSGSLRGLGRGGIVGRRDFWEGPPRRGDRRTDPGWLVGGAARGQRGGG